MNFWKNLFFGMLLFCSIPFQNAFAQDAEAPEFGAWYIYFGNQSFAKNKFVFHNEVQYRNYNLLGNREQLLLRGGLGYHLTENNNLLSAGYAFIGTTPLRTENDMAFVNEAGAFNEHRLWQQFITRQSFGRVNILHRYRYEQRWFDNNSDFRTRYRYFLSLNIALNKPTMQPKALYLSLYNEVFLNGERSEQRALFDRNRLFGAIGYQFNPFMRLEIGVMRQTVDNSLLSRNQLQVVFFNNIPFSR